MKMTDVGQKSVTRREAAVEATVRMKPSVMRDVKDNRIPKGNVLEAAKVAGIMAAKRAPEIIPLCHPIAVDYADVRVSFEARRIRIVTTVRGCARTGVEMEAFAAAAAAALTVYDMCKQFDRAMVISDLKLIRKSGGKSGTFVRKQVKR